MPSLISLPYNARVFITLVGFLLFVNVCGAVYLLLRADLERWKKAVFAVVAFTSLILKLILATRGHNFDLDSYGIVASIVLHGKSVYANTTRFNYGPLWALILAGLKQLSFRLPAMRGESFHLAVAAFLGVTDVAVAAVLSAKYRFGAGIFFLCCPPSILLTGYHSQFENLALLAGLASWVLIRGGFRSTQRLILAAALQGVSLVIKHVLFLLPLWVFFWPKLGNWRKRAAYAVIAYGVFGLSFLPWTLDPASRAGILHNVFLYRSGFTYSMSQLLSSIFLLALFPTVESTVLTLGWIVIVIAVGLIVARRNNDLLPMYLLAMFAFSPALRDQYLAICLLAGAIFYTSWPCWALTATATMALLCSPNDVFLFPLRYYHPMLASTQICAAAFLWVQLQRAGALRTESLPAWKAVRNAAALALGSSAFVWAILEARSYALR